MCVILFHTVISDRNQTTIITTAVVKEPNYLLHYITKKVRRYLLLCFAGDSIPTNAEIFVRIKAYEILIFLKVPQTRFHYLARNTFLCTIS